MAKRTTKQAPEPTVETFTFGDPETVIGKVWGDYLGVFADQQSGVYEPPFLLSGLAKMRNANAHHGSCLIFRRNQLASVYVPRPEFTAAQFSALALDYLTFGNAYIYLLLNAFGTPVGMQHIPALNMRVKADGDYRRLMPNGQDIDFPAERIIQISEYDTMQNIYGLPDWLGGLQSALLNEDATLFRRRYYVNGAHMGYVFLTTSAKMDAAYQAKLQKCILEGKGVGNFKSMYIHVNGGDKDDVTIKPIGDISQKDEFLNIKNISADDVLVAHRVPGALAGVRPNNVGGDGDVTKRRLVYLQTETAPLAGTFEAANDRLPASLHFRFNIPTGEASE